LVEAGGVEPPSVSPLPSALHAYTVFNLTVGYPTGRENQLRFRIGFSESTPDMLHRELVKVDA